MTPLAARLIPGMLAAALLSACGGGGGDGPRVGAAPQSLSFGSAPALVAGGQAQVQATSTSGLAPRYGSLTPDTCTVDGGSGAVVALASGPCTIVADQDGDASWLAAPRATLTFQVNGQAQQIQFAAAPALPVDGQATVRAVASSGLAVRYGSLTPAVCSVDAASGVVSAHAAGVCTLAADQDGDARWAAALRAQLDLPTAASPQTLDFPALPALQVGASATAAARAGSGLAVVYSALTPATCTVDANGRVSALTRGPCTVAANQPGNAAWAPAPQVTQTAQVAGRPQSLSAGAAPALAVGDSAALDATASSGLGVTWASRTPALCTVDAASGRVTARAAGGCTVEASQPGDSLWAAATPVVLALTVQRRPQALAFGSAPALAVGGAATVHASATSGLAVRYASLSPSVCSVNAGSGAVAGLAGGLCTVAANQDGDATWAPALQVTQTLASTGRAQTLVFGSAPALQVGTTATVHATASSGLAAAYASLTPAVCSVGAASGVVTGLASGTCVVAADQPGNATWAAAPQVRLTLTASLRPQALTFASPPVLYVGGTATVVATAESGLAPVYASLTPAVCTVGAGSGTVSATGSGSCTISATQAGNTTWAAAPPASLTLTATRRAQSVAFGAPPALQAGGSATVHASASSGLAVTYSSLTPAVCRVDAASGAVNSLGAGTCTVAADQAGNSLWAPAARATQGLSAGSRAQSIVFAAAPTLAVGGTATVHATAGSGLPVRFSSLTPSTCSVVAASGVVSGLAVGSCTVAADQDGDAVWAPAPQAVQTLGAGGRAQTLSFGTAPTLTVRATAAVNASASSGLPVSYASLTPAVCSVNSSTGLVSGLAAGACTLSASQGGNATWAPAPPASLTFAVSLAPQSLAFAAAPSLAVGGTAVVRATASSGLAPRYASLTPNVCSIDAASGSISGLAAGACTVSAQQDGNAVYAAAAPVTQTLAVSGRSQSIAFGAPPALSVGATASVSATASSGLAVSFATLTPGVCSVQPAGAVTGVGAGTCTVSADQPGNATWAAAPRATLDLAVRQATQTLAFGTAPALTVGASATVRASASSGLAVSYASLSSGICTVDGSSGRVDALAIGTCTVAANQAGNATWAAAPQATQSIAVAGRSQAVTFGSAPALAVGATVTVSASASSGLAVRYGSLTPAVCSANAGSGAVSGLAAGTCVISADQPGDATWAPAPQATLTLSVGTRAQTLAFGPAPALQVGATATVRATASSGLAVTYGSLSSGVCRVDAASGVVNGLAIGSCTITANQPGNAAWSAAPQATLTLQVSGREQSIAFGAAPALSAGGTASVHAAATSGLAVRYGSLTPAVCSVDAASGLVNGLAMGTCTISADQPGNADWSAAPQATLSFAVANDPRQTLVFGSAPRLTLGGVATVHASASSGLPVSYSSLSFGVCTVDAASGLVTDLNLGDCIIAADQPGNASYDPAPRVTQTLPVQVPAGVTVPGVPQGVTATLGGSRASVVVSVGAVDSGGNPIRRYTVVSSPAGVSATSATAPVTVNCPGSCSGYAFSVSAANGVGDGAASAAVHVRTSFDVLATFHEPDTQPRDTVFTGTLVWDSTTGSVASASGRLTESMTGNAVGTAPYYDMTQVALTYPLQTWHDDALGGSFVAVFAKNTTSTFAALAGGDGWSPVAGVDNGGLYAGFPAAYGSTVQNSYVLLFVPDDPFAALTPAQVDKLAYADCAPGGMMGAVCMTGTSVAGYGSTGTMSGYPVSQTLTRH